MSATERAVGPDVRRRVGGPPQSLAERERAALGDAARLAELWDLALRASFQLGYDTGHQRGLVAGRHEEASAWQAIVTGYSAVLDAPTRAELARARRPTDTPCPGGCGSCSRCVRADAVRRNLARYGRPDYPGRPDVSGRRAHQRRGAGWA